MILAYELNEDGTIKEIYVLEKIGDVLNGYITTELPQGLYKAKWDGTQWIEGATQEYINSINATTTPTPSIEDRMTALESAISSLMGV